CITQGGTSPHSRRPGNTRVLAMQRLTFREMLAYVGISQATYWRLQARGDAPTRVQLSPRRIVFLQTDLDDWLLGRRIGAFVAAPPRAAAGEQREASTNLPPVAARAARGADQGGDR